MFYLNEIYLRIIYLLFTILCSILALYILKNDIIFITIIPSLFYTTIIEYFIFTEPREILFFYLYSCFSFFFFSFVPYLIIITYDYFKLACYLKEWDYLNQLKIKFLFSYFLINFMTFFFGLPIFWKFFSSFQNETSFPFFFELNGLNYFYYFNSLFLVINIIQILLIFGLTFLYNKDFIRIILNKTYIILLFLIFSTLITPPDIFIQVGLFCSLYICLELFIFLFILSYIYKYKYS